MIKILKAAGLKEWGVIPRYVSTNNSNTLGPIPELDGVVPPPEKASNIMPELTDVDPGHPMFQSKNKPTVKVVPIPEESSINQNALDQGVNITTDDSAFEASNYKDDAKTYLHPGSNVLYTVDQNKQLVDIYGRPAPMSIQSEWNNKQAGVSNKADGTERTEMVVKEFKPKSIAELEAEALALKKKANIEVKNTGVVSETTITDIAKNNGITAQVTKKAENQEIKRQVEAVDNFNKIEDDYNTAKNNALSVGVTSFPTMSEWMKKQGLDRKDVNTTLSITNTLDTVNTDKIFENTGLPNINDLSTTNKNKVVKDEKANTLLKEITARTNAYNVSKTTTEESAEKALKLKNEKDKGKSLNQSKGFFAELFGDLIDKKELGRMAVMYAGSRALGNSHEGSLGFAAVNYIKRIDTKAANREKTALTLIAKGKHTTASIAAYKKSGDENDLILVGAPINSTGKDKYLFHPILKKKILVREFKQNNNVYWSADGGKSPVSGAWTSDGTAVRGSKDFMAYTAKAIPILRDVLNDDKKQYDKDKVDFKRWYCN